MARKPTVQQLYDELLDRYGREIADAFLAAVRDLATAADLQRMIAAIEAGNVDAALSALNLDAAAFGPMLEAIRSGYVSAGTLTAGAIRTAVTIRFDVRNPQAERWLADHSSTLITRIVADQQQAVRQALTDGMARGDNPRTTALNIVGRVDKATGQRVDGIIGLTAQQETFVANAREELESGEPAKLKNYLTRARRSKLFDQSVEKAIRDGAPLPAETVAKALTAYKSGLLKLRGDTIGLHESFAALGAAKDEAYRQAIANGQIDETAVTKRWRHFANREPRLQHIAVNGQTVGFRETFVMPDGTRLRYPHDPEAPIEHTAGCHCQADYRVDFLAKLDAAA